MLCRGCFCCLRHTNYLAYVKEGQASGFLSAAAVYRINRWVCRIHCHKVVKLSDAVQKLPRQVWSGRTISSS